MKSSKQSRDNSTKKKAINSSNKKIKVTNSFKKINTNVAGIDLGSTFHFVAAPIEAEKIAIRKFGTFTSDLFAMLEWLKKCRVESVAMEATGVYWMTVYEILEDHGFEVILVNSRNIKNVSGRKSDVEDAEWIQQLHSYGLLHGAFIPDKQTTKLRALVRQRSQLVEVGGQYIQRMQKVLIQMNLRLDNVISDISGKTGLGIINAIVRGETDPKRLAAYRDGRCKNTQEVIEESLKGYYKEEYVFVLKQHLTFYELIHTQILECERKILHILKEFENRIEVESSENCSDEIRSNRKKVKRKNEYQFDLKSELIRITGVDLTKLPGIQASTALTVISEIGLNMNRWPTPKHFASWLSLCPNNKMSGGKMLKSKTKRNSNRAATAFRIAVNGLYREVNDTALGVFFRRKKAHHGAPKAITAASNKLAKYFYIMLKTGKEFEEIGAEEYTKKVKEKQLRRINRQLSNWGYKIVKKEAA